MIKNSYLINIKINEIEKILKDTNNNLRFSKIASLDKDVLAKTSGAIIGNNWYILDCILPEMKKFLE